MHRVCSISLSVINTGKPAERWPSAIQNSKDQSLPEGRKEKGEHGRTCFFKEKVGGGQARRQGWWLWSWALMLSVTFFLLL